MYEDEVDIHLNPKIGPDWMLPGDQKRVLTPGQNQKRYLAGALNARTGKLTWVEGERKNSVLFLLLIHRLVTVSYRGARRIHIILDNYKIHDSRQVQLALGGMGRQGTAPSAALLSGSQSDRADLEGPPRQCDAEPLLPGRSEELMGEVRSYLQHRKKRRKYDYPRMNTG